MDPIIGANLVSAGSSVVNTLINQAFAEHNRERNYYWNEKAADSADKRQRAQYEDMYSPKALLEQYAAAGLSPSLMMSGGAPAVGQSSAQGNQSAGIQGPYPTAQIIDPLQAAQIANIKADTKKKEAETDNVNKDTELKGQEITNLVTENGYKQVATRLVVAQADLAECNADLAWETYMANLQSAYSAAEHAANIARSSGVQADLDESTFTAAYQKAWADLEYTLSATALNRSEIKLNAEEIKKIGSDIWAQQRRIHFESREQNRKDLRLSYDKQYMEQEISKWLREQNQWVEEMKLKGYEIKTEFLSDILGYVFNLAGVSLTNAAKPTKEVIAETIVDGKGQMTTKTTTKSKYK